MYMRKQPFGQNDVNARNGSKVGKLRHMRYENNATILIIIQFADELMNFNA